MPLQQPVDRDLGLFVYGTLKPGELGYHQIADVVASAKEASLHGFRLKIRDGLPLLVEGSGSIEGVVLHFTDPEPGYRRVCEFEPATQYKWSDRSVTVLIDGTEERANTLLGELPDAGAEELEGKQSWSSADDPVFIEGLHVASQMICDVYGRDPGDRHAFFQAQAAYLLLFSAVERAAALLFGTDTRPTDRVKKIRTLDSWNKWLADAEVNLDRPELVDSRDPDPRRRASLAENPWRYWYMVRSNLTHRGKSAHRDFKLVRDSFVDVHDVLRRLLVDLAPAVRTAWRECDPDGEEHGWRLRPVISARAVDTSTNDDEERR